MIINYKKMQQLHTPHYEWSAGGGGGRREDVQYRPDTAQFQPGQDWEESSVSDWASQWTDVTTVYSLESAGNMDLS